MTKRNEGKRRAARSVPLPGLRAQRQRQGITQRELAELAGITQGSVWKLEAGHRGAYPKTIRRLCQALGIIPDDLLREDSAER
jgi:transcriptional regulator with XRE-family HTH domain